uniref:Tripartite motif containing 35-12 n=1 Tax=Paramormyrops kingsleyae TaxID=1676925 RepID=A0A3B3RJY9_9TELE
VCLRSLVDSFLLSCCICSDFFRDPVVLKCAHSFCGACLQRFWAQNSSRECPLCRRKSSVGDPPLNIVLRNVVELYSKQRSEREVVEKSASRCSLHGEKILLFCIEDQEPICVVCLTAKKRRNHQLCPVEEAVQDKKKDLRASLILLKEKLEKFTKVKQEFEETAKHIKSQSQQTEKRIKEEFEKLHQFLREEEEARLSVLREEEVQKSKRMKDEIENISQQVSTLAQCSLQYPKLPSGALIDVTKHLGSLRFKVWEKMLEIVQYTPVTLDLNTAHPWLSVSDDLTSLRDTGVKQQLPDNPERFTHYVNVLGSEGFNSGKRSWEVTVGDKPEWDVGVVKGSAMRRGKFTCSPQNGFWVIGLRNGDEYKAFTSPSTRLRVKWKPRRIRVQLDYDRGEVSFFNPADMSLIYTFKDRFTGTLFPVFSPCVNNKGSNTGALKICPVRLSVTAESDRVLIYQ